MNLSETLQLSRNVRILFVVNQDYIKRSCDQISPNKLYVYKTDFKEDMSFHSKSNKKK